MQNKRMSINDEELDKVVGGLFTFHRKSKVMDYQLDEEGNVKKYQILDFDKAWEMSNLQHAKMVPEDQILAQMISAGYIAE